MQVILLSSPYAGHREDSFLKFPDMSKHNFQL